MKARNMKNPFVVRSNTRPGLAGCVGLIGRPGD